MNIFKKYKLWRNFNELLDYWGDREFMLEGVKKGYKPRTRPQWYAYGQAVGELETIQRAMRILKYDFDEDDIEPCDEYE